MSKHLVRGGDIAALLERFTQLQEKTHTRTGKRFEIIVIQEAGLDGFWIHRVLQSKGINSHIVDPASIATSRRRRRAKTDRIDGEVLVRALLAYKRGEPRVCAMGMRCERSASRMCEKLHTRKKRCSCLSWVKLRRTQCEQMPSGLHLKADIAQCGRHFAFVP
jgi:transposase